MEKWAWLQRMERWKKEEHERSAWCKKSSIICGNPKWVLAFMMMTTTMMSVTECKVNNEELMMTTTTTTAMVVMTMKRK